MHISKLALSVVLTSVIAVAHGQADSVRYTPPSTGFLLSTNGVPVMVGYEHRFEAGDPGSATAKEKPTKQIVRIEASQNGQSLRFVNEILHGHASFPLDSTLHREDDGAAIGFMATGLSGLIFPELRKTKNIGAPIRSLITMALDSDMAGPVFLGHSPLSAAEQALAKADRKMKPWSNSEFHFKLDGQVDPMVTGVSEIRVVSVGDLDGDGAPELRTAAPIEITIPEASLLKYLGAIGSDPTSPPVFKICWLNDQHEPFVTFMGRLEVAGWGPVDPFTPPSDTREVKVRIARGDVALIVDTTCSMSGM